jgi:predicted AlkP superfamily phosphohydrolase/phosphomutase
MKKLLVFGLDGASFSVLEAYSRANPDGIFNQWLTEGYARVLLSTLPYFTAPAWATFMTGLEPGQHGMYHWRGRYDHKTGDRPLISSVHVNEATFWWYCQQNGGRVSVSNFPMQYPAPPTDGRYICGTLAPEDAPNVTWPNSLIDKLRAALPQYRFEMDKGLSYMDRPKELLDHILMVGNNQLRALELFGSIDSVHLLVHVVTIIDRMQHFFWHCFDEQHPNHIDSPRSIVGNPIFDAYALAEAALQKLWDRGVWENVIIVSDHGMGLSKVSFHTDVWLAGKGYAAFGENGRVNIGSSVAYSGEEPEGAIYVNKVSRDGCGVQDEYYQAFVEGLRQDLLKLIIPGLNQPAFTQVFTQSELYKGIASEIGPDLVLVSADGVHPRPGRSELVFDRATRLYAGHRPEGIFIGYGADFMRSPLSHGKGSIQIQDMFPLMCALMNIPIPNGLPGMIPEEILQGLSSQPEYDSAWYWQQQVQSLPFTQSPAPDVLARLAELGYI